MILVIYDENPCRTKCSVDCVEKLEKKKKKTTTESLISTFLGKETI
jgi:hypothetical protein